MSTATSTPSLVHLRESDDVAIAATDLTPGAHAFCGERAIPVRGEIARGHKIALHDVDAGAAVRRYGQVIGFASADIAQGEHVHGHNLEYREFARDFEFAAEAEPERVLPADQRATFEGYRRSDGKVGTRNFLGVLTSVNCSATAAKHIAQRMRFSGVLDDFDNVDGVVALTHGTGCGMAPDGAGIEVLRRVLRGYLTHPNFAGFLVLGLGCEDNQIVQLTRDVPMRPDVPVVTSTIQELGGTAKTVQEGVARLTEMLPAANAVTRETVPASELILGAECGGSDAYSGITANPALGAAVDRLVRHGGTGIVGETPEIYGAEHMLLQRAASAEVGQRLVDRISWWQEYTAKNGGSMDNNPSPGNKAGGLTTILEKSLGAVTKAGTTTMRDVVKYAESVTTRGFVFMDTPGYDPVSVTGKVAGGANLVCFTTGRGSAFGCAPVPSMKLATNTPLYEHMHEDMDVNCGRIIDGDSDVERLGQELFEHVLRVASGEYTKSEELGYGEEEFVPWHIGTVM